MSIACRAAYYHHGTYILLSATNLAKKSDSASESGLKIIFRAGYILRIRVAGGIDRNIVGDILLIILKVLNKSLAI